MGKGPLPLPEDGDLLGRAFSRGSSHPNCCPCSSDPHRPPSRPAYSRHTEQEQDLRLGPSARSQKAEVEMSTTTRETSALSREAPGAGRAHLAWPGAPSTPRAPSPPAAQHCSQSRPRTELPSTTSSLAPGLPGLCSLPPPPSEERTGRPAPSNRVYY